MVNIDKILTLYSQTNEGELKTNLSFRDGNICNENGKCILYCTPRFEKISNFLNLDDMLIISAQSTLNLIILVK